MTSDHGMRLLAPVGALSGPVVRDLSKTSIESSSAAAAPVSNWSSLILPATGYVEEPLTVREVIVYSPAELNVVSPVSATLP